MSLKFTQLQCREVICITDGRRLGFIRDLQVEIPEGRICALIVQGQGKLFGLAGHHDDFCIPWACIQKIGPDIVLVDVKPEDCRIPRPKRALL